MSNLSRRKGARVENEIVHKLNHHGIPARKRSGMYIPGHDIDAVVRGRTLRVEVKSRTKGFGTIYNWLSDREILIVKADYRPALVVLPLDLAAQLVSTAAVANLAHLKPR
jgi:hypothetical protein